MRLRFTPRAAKDIAEIADYISQENPRAAERVRASILEALQTLATFPAMGRMQSVENVRKLVTRKYGYLVYYQADMVAGEIVVLSIRHPARERQYDDR